MPSTLPSTFASAAAGNNDSASRGASRAEGPGEPWGRRTNGATQTFRRPSTATSQSHTREPSQNTSNLANTTQPSTPSIGAYVPPHISRHNTILETRYSRNQLLDLFKEQRDAGDLETDLNELYVGESEHPLNGGGNKWSRHDSKENGVGLEICWDRGGGIEPLGLVEMTDAEKELFTTSVNSPIKAATTQGNRENNQRDTLNRKTSGLGGSAAAFASPGLTRTSNRRRAPSESYPFPSADAPAEDDIPEGISAPGSGPGLSRRKTERQDDIAEQTDEVSTPGTAANTSVTGFGSLKRNPFGPISAGLNGPASPWGPSAPAASSPMGSFRGIGFGSTPTAASTASRPGFGSTRGGSRFADLMKTSIEDEPSSLHSKPSLGSFGVAEDPASRRHTPGLGDESSERAVSRAGTLGSAALGGLHDISDSRPTSANPAKGRGGLYAQGQGVGHDQEAGLDDPNSPTYTNPYQSPPHQLPGMQGLSEDMDMNVLPGLGGFQRAPGQDSLAGVFNQPDDGRQGQFSHEPRPFERTDSNRGFPSLGGLGGLGGLPGLGSSGAWSNGLATTTPGRERLQGDAFDNAMRAPGAFGSPSGGIGGSFGTPDRFGLGGTGTIGRGSKLSSLYSGSTQDQLLGSRDDGAYDQGGDVLNGLGGSRRGTESPFRAGRGKFDDFFHSGDKSGEQNQTYSPASALQTPLHQPGPGQRVPSVASSSSNQIPASQQKTMVMPDRIRWVYKDPQGNTQGPWTGLEMHDWYRAGFFSPELLVKKVEDADYEPLAQLIRRIGNSREPFLVPQIGIPGPATAQAAPQNAWSAQNVLQTPAVQPPFAGSFPSFGTTLTADQQNALERRKQEEQYLMHQQKEHLAWQQNLAKQVQMQGQQGLGRQQLTHQQSMQSLHSQPSYASANSPSTFQAHLAAGNGAAYDAYNRGMGAGAIGTGADNLSNIREETMTGAFGVDDKQAQGAIGQQHAQEDINSEQRVAAMLADRARLAQEQAEQEQEAFQDTTATNDRLNEFLELRRQEEEQEQAALPVQSRQVSGQKSGQANKSAAGEVPIEKLSLTEQVQKAASAKASPAVAPKSGWAHADLETLPPPQSISPLPAPAARRNRANMADTLAAESISVPQSPAPETPTSSALAPWANAIEQSKQPSLREIQEAEARRAAKQEEILAGLRRAQLEKEMAELAKQPQAPAPGLPTSSTWATSEAVPAVPASTASPWAKANATKAASTGASATKKTLQQIQAEEEAIARKKKATLAAAAASVAAIPGAAPLPSGGKRYADLASKAAAPPPSTLGTAWTTVGASGKVKTPAPTPSAAARSISTSTTPTTATKATKPSTTSSAPSTATNAKTTLAAAQKSAQDEFKKWAVAELRPDLDKSIQVDEFVMNLLSLPSDVELVTEAVHMSSRTMDSRHFAEEFVRRRALAEKGKMEAGAMGVGGGAEARGQSGSGAGGWSEVARRAGAGVGAGAAGVKEEASAFKIVAKKGKGKK